MNAINAQFVERRCDELETFIYEPTDRARYTKLFAVDDRFAIVTSTNMSRRSFKSDSENRFVFLDEVVVRAIRREIERALG